MTKPVASERRYKHRLKEVTARDREQKILRSASILADLGFDCAKFGSISAIVEPANVEAIVEVLLQRSSDGHTVYVHQMVVVLCALAEHWVRADRDSLKKLKCIRRDVAPDKDGLSPKVRKILRGLKDEKTQLRFLEFPERTFASIEQQLSDDVLLDLQVATACAILHHAPVRPKNLVEIVIGKELTWQKLRNERKYHLTFEIVMVKNKRRLEYWLPRATSLLVDRYIREVRPGLVRGTNNYLFPNTTNGHKDAGQFSQQIKDAMMREVGLPITAHRFRHAMGLLFLLEHPGGHEVVCQLIGDTRETVIRNYTGEEREAALQFFEDAITKRLHSLRS